MSDTSPHIRHRVQMPDGKHVEVVYRDHRRAPEPAAGAPYLPEQPGTGAPDAAYLPEQPGARAPDAAYAPERPDTPDSSYAPDSSPASDASYAPDPSCPPSPSSAPGQAFSAEPVCAPEELHVCFNCAGELVYPLDWVEEGARHWRIMLRCPECEALREGVFEQSVVERLDDELDRAAHALLSDLKRITHANMTDEVEFFVRALDADLIVPSDF
jgi:hypothetical protein